MKKLMYTFICGCLMLVAAMTIQAQKKGDINSQYYREIQVGIQDGKYGLLFRSEVIVPYQYDTIVAQQGNQGFISQQGGKYGIISVFVLHDGNDTGLQLYTNEKRYFFKEQGSNKKDKDFYLSVLNRPCEYNEIKVIDGKYWVSKEKQKGVLNSVGGIIVHCEYDEIKVNDGKYWVSKGTQEGVLNSVGGIIVHCEYDKIKVIDGKYWVSKGTQQGVLNFVGGIIVHCEYDEIKVIDGKYWVSKEKQKGVLNSVGGVILGCEFDKIELTSDSKYITYKDKKKSLYNSVGGLIHTDFEVVYSTD